MSQLLRMESVSKVYRRGSGVARVLQDVSLEVHAGEVVCVLASRGQGKSTLLRIAAGVERPDAGTVLFDGEDLGGLPDRDLSALLGRRIAWAGRTGPGLRLRMLDYVAMPLMAARGSGALRALFMSGRRAPGERDAYGRAQDALERVGALACAGRRWEEISDWERALVELAQAIVARPALALVDDLADGLGIRETDELTTLVRELSRELSMGVLMGVSDGAAALRCDRIAMLSAGTLTESAPAQPAEVIELATSDARRARRRHSSA